jgi:hypothetical protein
MAWERRTDLPQDFYLQREREKRDIYILQYLPTLSSFCPFNFLYLFCRL